MAGIDYSPSPICLTCDDFMTPFPDCAGCDGTGLPLFALGSYHAPLKEILLQFKFHGVTDSVNPLAERLVEPFGDKIKSLKADALLPIPLHPSREYSRGYNQSLLLAEQLAKLLDLSVSHDLIVRTEKRKPQQSLSPTKRAANIKGVYSHTSVDTDIARVLIVDDIVTTGLTVKEAIKTLETIDVKTVGVLALAH